MIDRKQLKTEAASYFKKTHYSSAEEFFLAMLRPVGLESGFERVAV
ncbi:hypothetical protein [Leisingera sp. NJS201]|nr:hypothetical protein [Leisingera sp. NJS201]